MVTLKTKIFICGDWVYDKRCDFCDDLFSETGFSSIHEKEKDIHICEKCIDKFYNHFNSDCSNYYEIKRKIIPESLKLEIYERDNYKCRYCGSVDNLTIDHIIPVIHGGENTKDNLVIACKSCNTRKGARTLKESGLVLMEIS
jgi:CRISPR/Cas system Type II protein with McrA/HNH and RuvC-like nuclease domain